MNSHQLESNDNEKTQVSQDHVENTSPSNEKTELETESYENNNKYAVKGDDSDGKIAWTWKTRIAACCLVTLYVGK